MRSFAFSLLLAASLCQAASTEMITTPEPPPARDSKQLELENAQLARELDNIRKLSANAVAMDEQNKELLRELEQTKNRLDTQTMEIERLQERLENDQTVNFIIIVVFSVLMTLGIQYLVRSNKRASEWA
jgi:SH3 domain protein